MSPDNSSVRYRILKEHSGCRVGSDGSFWRFKAGRWVRIYGSKNDHNNWLVIIPGGTAKSRRCVKIAVLVLTAFVGPKPPGMECCHKDDNKDDNSIENLYWGTHKENMLDRDRHGLNVNHRGSAHGMSKLTEERVREIRKLWETGTRNQALLARMFNVTPGTIRQVIKRKTWNHVL
jgi:hypothetical protein